MAGRIPASSTSRAAATPRSSACSREAEPQIWDASHRFGAVLENVVADARGNLDLNDGSLTENTRSCYPLEFIPNTMPGGVAPRCRRTW